MTPTNSELREALEALHISPCNSCNQLKIKSCKRLKKTEALIDKQVTQALAQQREDIRKRLPEKYEGTEQKHGIAYLKKHEEGYNLALAQITKILERGDDD